MDMIMGNSPTAETCNFTKKYDTLLETFNYLTQIYQKLLQLLLI